ncbi:putative cytokinetic ring protein SteA [Effusibacillus dendaii]|uniref:putative cytokinetic ring protein SteA n=1 Tax=Effusibacillus dendaii TaxID=2743772 RepID=UPI001CF7EA0A|nr:putative cytokinetic ring protein SteA [Effusibacillus dendaii]
MTILPKWAPKQHIRITGPVRSDLKTKRLIPRLQPGDIAVLAHEDIDEMAARGLIQAKVSAVVNTRCSITARYPNRGPLLLLQAGIPLLDMTDLGDDERPDLLDFVQDGDPMTILDRSLYVCDRYVGQAEILTKREIVLRTAIAKQNAAKELENFLENTLQHANKEKSFFLGSLPTLKLRTAIEGKHVLVVVRGSTYQADLRTISHYIKEQKPVLIGVDGGADALLQAGFQPDLIIGDMDSISDHALKSGGELIVHAYLDGRAPGWARIQKLGLHAHKYPAPGTSEDIAMLIAHEAGAELIVAVGTHTHMIDFLEKGRRGMASTLLTRLRVGPKLVDAKGVSQLYQQRMSWTALVCVVLASMLPVAVLAAVNPIIRNILRIIYWQMRLAFS